MDAGVLVNTICAASVLKAYNYYMIPLWKDGGRFCVFNSNYLDSLIAFDELTLCVMN